MKTAVVCAIVLLTSACRQTVGSSSLEESREEIVRAPQLSRAMHVYWKKDNPYYIRRDFDFRGPLDARQVEDELMELHKSSSRTRQEVYGVAEEFDESDVGKQWERLKSKHREGDELYFFTASDRRTLTGDTLGYVLMRHKKVVDVIVTIMT